MLWIHFELVGLEFLIKEFHKNLEYDNDVFSLVFDIIILLCTVL